MSNMKTSSLIFSYKCERVNPLIKQEGQKKPKQQQKN